MAKPKSRAKAKKPSAKKSTPKKKPTSKKAAGNVTSPSELDRLARLSDDCRAGGKKFSDKIGGEIKIAAKTKHLNAKAFRAIIVERRMGLDDPIRLRDYLDACEYYRDELGVLEMKAPDMMATPKAKTQRQPKSTKASGEMKPLGEAAGNVVNLAGAMADAIEKDKANQIAKPDMVA